MQPLELFGNPSRAVNDAINNWFGNSKHSSHRPTGFLSRITLNKVHLRPVELCHSVFSAGWMTRSSLSFHVPHVVSLSAKKKMVWIHAKFIVTPMTDKFIFRVSSSVKQPYQSVRLPVPAKKSYITILTRAYASIPNYASCLGWNCSRINFSFNRFDRVPSALSPCCNHGEDYASHC